VKARIEQRMTELMKRGLSVPQICESIKLKEKDLELILGKYVNGIAYLEDALKKL
jgi:hypothetical protein